MLVFSSTLDVRVTKFKHPLILGDQQISEENQNLRPGCPPDYQIFCEKIDARIYIPTCYFSLNNKNSRRRTSTTLYHNEDDQNNDKDDQILNFGFPPTDNFRIEFCNPDYVIIKFKTYIPL